MKEEFIANCLKWIIKRPPGWNTLKPRWFCVSQIFGVGSHTARDLCVWAECNPEEVMTRRSRRSEPR